MGRNSSKYKAYKGYLASPEWKEKRRIVLSRDRFRCQKCGDEERVLHVHHLTYERLGDERLDDLLTLCAQCHKKEHATKTTKLIQPVVGRKKKQPRHNTRLCKFCHESFLPKQYPAGGGAYCSGFCRTSGHKKAREFRRSENKMFRDEKKKEESNVLEAAARWMT